MLQHVTSTTYWFKANCQCKPQSTSCRTRKRGNRMTAIKSIGTQIMKACTFAGFSVAMIGSSFTTAAFAMSGHAAAVACERNPHCHVRYNGDGSIEIVTDDGHYIVCKTPRGQCGLLWRKAPGSTKVVMNVSQIESVLSND